MPMSADTTITCPKCGAKNKSDRKYCKECWWPLGATIKPDC